MKRSWKSKIGAVGLVLAGTLATSVAPALADYAPSPTDVVGVGGDTPQYAVNFLADGDVSGDAGYNSAGGLNKWVGFTATADQNGRQAYANGSTLAAPVNLNPTIVLRAGTVPVQRVSSSGNALTAFIADTNQNINYISSSSLPSAAQQTAAANAGWGFLHVVQFGTDSVKIVTANTTNAPAALSIAELVGIYKGTYTTWNQLPGNSGGSTETIVPLIPPSSSAIYKALLADLKTANGGVAVTLSSAVKTVEQNDPSAITSSSSPANAIVPFSLARLNLYNAGYFHNPATAYPGSASAISAGIKALTGTAPDSANAWSSVVNDYVIFRQSDANSATPYQPGGTRNWVQTLFSNPSGSTPFIGSAVGQALITAAGVTPLYNDLGNVSA